MDPFTWFIVLVVLSVGLAYAGGMLTQDVPEVDEGKGATGTKGTLWNPVTTQQEGIAKPRAWGKNLHHGNIIAKWTDVTDNHEVLHLLIDHGDGPTKGVTDLTTDVFLNDQPAGNFTSVEIQQRLGTMNQTCMTGFEAPKLEYKVNTELVFEADPIIFTTPNDFFDDIEYTIMFPSGQWYQHKSGGIDAYGTPFKVRIREVGGGWTIIYNSSEPANSRSALFHKFVVSDYYVVNRGTQYELEFSKLAASHSRLGNTIFIRSIREVVDTAFTRPGRALVGIRAVATSQLSGNMDVKVIREDRIVNVYDGTDWTLEYSNNRAWVAWDAATLPVIDGDGDGTPYSIVRYEGVDPKYLDLEFFYAWSIFCEGEINDGYGATEPRCPCNIIVKEFTNIFDLVYKIAAVGRANIYSRGHLLTGWIDDAVTTPIDLVTMDSIMHKSWKNAWAIDSQMAGVIEIFYQDEKQGYERTSAVWANEDAGGYRNTVSSEGVGLKTRGSAVHYAAYLLERNRLIRNKNQFRVHKEGFRYKLGDTIRLQCRIANWGKAFRVMNSTADTITVDRDASIEVSGGDALHIRTYDTVLKAVVTDTYVVDSVAEKVITITENWDVTPIKGNLVATGITKLRRIVKKGSTSDNYFDIEVETYDVDLFDTDSINPDNPNVNYIWPGALPRADKPITRQELEDSVFVPFPIDVNIPWPSNLTWSGNSVDTISWAKTDADDDIIFRLAGTDHVITGDSTTDLYIYWDPGSPTEFLSTDNRATMLASLMSGGWLMATNLNGVVYSATPMQIVHGSIVQANTIITEHLTANLITYNELRQIDGSEAVDTGAIRDNATGLNYVAQTAGGVTNPASSNWGTKVDAQTLTHTNGLGHGVKIGGSITITRSGTASTIHLYARLMRNSTVLKDYGSVLSINDNDPHIWNFNEIDWPTAGSPVYVIQCHGDIDDSNYGTLTDRNMSTSESLGK